MAMRLSELLERIRPAGTPGSADSAESNVERAAAVEIAAVATVLRRFDEKIDTELAEARSRSDAIRADGERRAALVRDGAVEQVAVAATAARESDRARVEDERRRVAATTSVEIERRRTSADAAREQLVDRVFTLIRSSAESREPEGLT